MIDDLYEQIIIDHYRHPQGKGLREPFDAEVMHVNPTCGDEITLRVTLGAPATDGGVTDGRVTDGRGTDGRVTDGGAPGGGAAAAPDAASDLAAGSASGSGSGSGSESGSGSGSAPDPASRADLASRKELVSVSGLGVVGPGEAIVEDISYDNQGCAISQGSASVMYELLVGKSVVDALVVYEQFRSMVHNEGIVDEDALGDAVAFEGVAKYSARVKCALLAWTAWKDATARALAQGER